MSFYNQWQPPVSLAKKSLPREYATCDSLIGRKSWGEYVICWNNNGFHWMECFWKNWSSIQLRPLLFQQITYSPQLFRPIRESHVAYFLGRENLCSRAVNHANILILNALITPSSSEYLAWRSVLLKMWLACSHHTYVWALLLCVLLLSYCFLHKWKYKWNSISCGLNPI